MSSVAVSSCAISISCDILAATVCWILTDNGGLMSLPDGVKSDDVIFNGEQPTGCDRYFATGRVYYQHWLFHLLAFIIFFTLYRVLKGIYWEQCNY